MGRFHKLAFWLKYEYERPIVDGRKQWEGRAIANGNRASTIRAGDTVGFRISRPRRRGFVRRLQFRVSAIKRFPSCRAMLRGIGIQKLLPGFDGDLDQACELYEGLVGGGRYAAWRIDRRGLRVQEKKIPERHWTRKIGMLENGKEQPKLNAAQELVIRRFGEAMLRAGTPQHVVLGHQDRLRFLRRAAYSITARGLWPLHSCASRGNDDQRRLKISKLNLTKFGLSKVAASATAARRKSLQASFNWLLKYADRKRLSSSQYVPAMKASPTKKRRR